MNLRIDSTLGFANLRSTPNTSVAPIDRLPVGHLVTTTGNQQGEWQPCQTTVDGNTLNGFVHASLLRPEINPEVDRLVEAAGIEFKDFLYGTLAEGNAEPRIREYWQALNLPFESTDVAWSAVFISFIVRKAALAKSFRFSERHTTYLSDSKRAKINGDASKAYWAVRLSERKLQIGDLVGAYRTAGTAACPNVVKTYDSLPGDFCAHCNVVVGIHGDQAIVMGGNVDQTVAVRKVPLTADGKAKTGEKRITIMARNF